MTSTRAPKPADERLADQRDAWRRKPALRAVYTDCYRRMAASCGPGRTLEIGGGSGNFKEFAPHVVSTDIVALPWLDAVCDAHRLPFRDAAFGNVVLFDVLHHLAVPRRFLAEAVRVLRPGGRIVVCEPAVTVASWAPYRFVHPEPVRMREDPLADAEAGARDPFDSNQAIPTLLFGRHRRRLAGIFPELRLRRMTYFALLAYPLSGGFRPWSLLPAPLVAPILRLDTALARWLGRVMGFRLLAVLERRSPE